MIFTNYTQQGRRLGKVIYERCSRDWDKALPRKRNTYFVSSLQSQVGSLVRRRGLETIAQRMLSIGKEAGWPSGVGGKVDRVCFRGLRQRLCKGQFPSLMESQEAC